MFFTFIFLVPSIQCRKEVVEANVPSPIDLSTTVLKPSVWHFLPLPSFFGARGDRIWKRGWTLGGAKGGSD